MADTTAVPATPDEPDRPSVPPAARRATPSTPSAPVGSAAPFVPPTPAYPDDTTPARQRLRVGTVVWGLVLAVLGVGVIAWSLGAQIDVEVAFVALVGGAGLALLIGSIVAGLRSTRR